LNHKGENCDNRNVHTGHQQSPAPPTLQAEQKQELKQIEHNNILISRNDANFRQCKRTIHFV
jgi:hypothetical protein